MLNKFRHDSVKRKVLSAAILPAVVMSLSLTIYYMYHRHNAAIENFHEKGVHIATAIAAASEYGLLSDNKDYLKAMINKIVDDPEILLVEVLDQDGEMFLKSGVTKEPSQGLHQVELPIYSQLVDINVFDVNDDVNLDRLNDTEAENRIIGHVNINMSSHLIQRKQLTLLLSGIALACIALLFSVFAGIRLARSIINPLKVIIDGVSTIRAGQYKVDFDIQESGEIGTLATDIATLGQELDTAKQREKQQLMEVTQARDIADRANASKTVFLGTVSHELKNPLNAVLLNIEVLKSMCEDDYLIRFIRTCYGATKQLSRSIDNFVNQSMVDIGQLYIHNEYFEIKEAIENIVLFTEEWLKKKQLKLNVSFDISPDLESVYLLSAPDRLQQILLNLVDNAIRYTDQGEINIRIKLLKKSEKQANLMIEVEDTGIGIPSDQLDAVFEFTWQVDPILSRRYGGLGLGLFIVKELTEALHGDICVKSREGEGTCFKLELNCLYSTEKGVVTKNTLLENHQLFNQNNKRKKILLIEDDADNRSTIEMILKHYGCEIDIAADGFEGSNLYYEKDYDIVFIDCYMPNLDGYNCARLIRKYEVEQSNDKKAFLVALTAAVGRNSKEKCYESGIDKVITKPCSVIDLIGCINDHVISEKTALSIFKEKGYIDNDNNETD